MIITPIKTHKITIEDKDLLSILDKYLPPLKDGSVVAITSKIVSICQGRVVKDDGKISRFELAKNESQYFLPEKFVKYGVHLTITNNVLIASAGIDKSNGNGYFVFWPKDVMEEARKAWEYLRKKHKIKDLGIVITDSHLTPLRRGVTGFGLAWCGFEPLKNYIGTPDVFGKNLQVTKSNVVDGLAASAVLLIGEGNEQTPLAVIKEASSIKFKQNPPSKEEINEMRIDIKDDIYSALINSVRLQKGGGK